MFVWVGKDGLQPVVIASSMLFYYIIMSLNIIVYVSIRLIVLHDVIQRCHFL